MSTTRLNLRVILSMGLPTVCGAAFAGGPFEIDRRTIDGGVIQITGGHFELSGTLGQADAGMAAIANTWSMFSQTGKRGAR